MPISFDISPLYCSPRLGEGDYHLSLGNLTFTLRVEESVVVNDEETITVPLRVDPLTVMTAPQDYARNQTMKVCYFVGNLDDKTREKLEIEFEMHDRTDDVIIDYISPVSVNAQEMLLKVKDYGLRNVPDPKTYHLRGFLYENGTLFSPTYLTGEDTAQVDLSQLPPFEGIWASFMRRSREVIS